MGNDDSLERLEDPAELARCGGWREEIYRDLMAVQDGALTAAAFDQRYLRREAVLVLDLTGFTEGTMTHGPLHAFLRILNAQKVCIPILRKHGALRVHAFADDLVAIYDEPNAALDAALEIHRRTAAQGEGRATQEGWPDCCIGLGWGTVYAIGPNRAMGDEMNRASKLGEDTARGGETLVTEAVRARLAERGDVEFAPQRIDDVGFPFFRVEPR